MKAGTLVEIVNLTDVGAAWLKHDPDLKGKRAVLLEEAKRARSIGGPWMYCKLKILEDTPISRFTDQAKINIYGVILRAIPKKDAPVEVSRCLACGNLDTIKHTSDAGVCMECGTPENYEYITEQEVEK